MVGCGGVGSAIAASLAAAGVGMIAIFDANAAAGEALAGRFIEYHPNSRSRPARGILRLRCGRQRHPAWHAGGGPAANRRLQNDPATLVGEVVMKEEYTPLLRLAKEKGCSIQVGTEMLFEQIPAYIEFFGFGRRALTSCGRSPKSNTKAGGPVRARGRGGALATGLGDGPLAQAVILILGHRHRVGLAEVLDLDPIGFARAEGGNRSDAGYAKGNRTDGEGNIGRARVAPRRRTAREAGR